MEQMEEKYNIYIDIKNLSYNHDSYDATYGWLPIPENWYTEE